MKIYQVYEDSDEGYHIGTFSTLERAQSGATSGLDLDTPVVIFSDELDELGMAQKVMTGYVEIIEGNGVVIWVETPDIGISIPPYEE